MKSANIILNLLNIICVNGILLSLPGHAATYPERQIEVIVPYAAGGGTDLVTRAFAETAKKYLPKPLGIVNKTGGGGAVGLTEIASARPNGYKIGTGTAELTMLPHMGLVRFSAHDFTPIARLNADPAALSVQAGAPWKTYEEFMAYAQANPGKVRIGNSGTGAIWHLAAEALAEKTGTIFNHVPYDGANPAVTALLGGHIEAVTVSPAEVSAHIASGKIKLLAVMADERSPSFPDVPTLKEKGVDLSILTWRGIIAPKNVPQDIINVLREAAKKTADDEDFKIALSKMNLHEAYLDGPQFQEVILKDDAFFKELMIKIGISK